MVNSKIIQKKVDKKEPTYSFDKIHNDMKKMVESKGRGSQKKIKEETEESEQFTSRNKTEDSMRSSRKNNKEEVSVDEEIDLDAIQLPK